MKKTVLTLFLCPCFHALHAQSQQASAAPREDKVYVIVDQMPEFKGGQDSLEEYVTENTHTPRSKCRGKKVFVQFMIDTAGVPMHVKAVKSDCADCDKEAVRVVRSMPPWAAGMQKGHKVNVQYSIPIEFPDK